MLKVGLLIDTKIILL